MTKATSPIRADHHTITPHLILKDTAKAIEFYKKAFDAKELYRITTPDGRIMNATLKIGDSHFMLADEMPNSSHGWASPQTLKGANVTIHLGVTDVDKVFQDAIAAGAKAEMPPQDMFWGDRYGRIVDPFGQPWSIATHKEELTAEEMQERANEFIKQMAACAK